MIPISAYNPYFFFVESYSTIKMCVFAKNFLKIDGAIAILSFMEKFLNFFLIFYKFSLAEDNWQIISACSLMNPFNQKLVNNVFKSPKIGPN